MVTIDTERTGAAVNSMLNAALLNAVCQRTSAWMVRSRERLDLPHAHGHRGGSGCRNYNFGNIISRPAQVVDGKVVFID